jgi:hypothetical protein
MADYHIIDCKETIGFILDLFKVFPLTSDLEQILLSFRSSLL